MTLRSTDAILTALETDAPLEALLGGPGRVRPGSLPNPERMPEVVVNAGTGLTVPGFGYRVHGHRDEETTTAVDCWAEVLETAQACMERAKWIVLRGIPGIDPPAWIQTTDAAQDPVRQELYHAVLRFPARHPVSDL